MLRSRPQEIAGSRDAAVLYDELLRIIGDIDERKAIEIIALHPTAAEIEEAAIWAAGDGDVLAKAGRPLTGTSAEIFEILSADEEEEPPPIR